MWHARRRRDVHTQFGWENQKGRNHMEDLGIYERKTLQLILENRVEMVWTEFIWLRIRARVKLY
jgi:hypothetical protein